MARPRVKKRTAAQQAASDEPSKSEAAKRGRGKRVKVSPNPKVETEYFSEKRNLLSEIHDDLSRMLVSVYSRIW